MTSATTASFDQSRSSTPLEQHACRADIVASGSAEGRAEAATGWVLTVTDTSEKGAGVDLEELYPSFEAAVAALLLQHLTAFAHPVELTSLARDRWLMKHLDNRTQPVDLVCIYPRGAGTPTFVAA